MIRFLFLGFLIWAVQNTHAQIENGSVLKLSGGSIIKGELLSSDSVYKVKLLDGSVFDIKKHSVSKILTPEQVILFSNGKYNYKGGFLLYANLGFGTDHSSGNISFARPIRDDLELSLGIGIHSNWLGVPIANWISFSEVIGYPIFLSGKYYVFPKAIRRPYITGTVGYNNNSADASWSMTKLSGGPLFELGLGMSFSSRNKTRFYCEIVQYNSYAKGSMLPTDFNILSETVDFNVWFNKIVFRTGIFIGSGK